MIDKSGPILVRRIRRPVVKKALLVIDLQNDYFPDGKFPLWNAERTLDNAEATIRSARHAGVPVILIQHSAPAGSPFFAESTAGAEIHRRVFAAAADAPVVTKAHADSFEGTKLAAILDEL